MDSSSGASPNLRLLGTGAIRWNFTKFLIDRKGAVIRRYAPSTKPASLAPAIEELLKSQ